jgi:hypothetical protein
MLTLELPPELVAETIAIRRDIHAHPELAFAEHRTAALVAAMLRALGLEVHEGIGGTGVVGLLSGTTPGPTIMLRADMDALPMPEESTVPFASQNPGVMHACGHDAERHRVLAVDNVGRSGRCNIRTIVHGPTSLVVHRTGADRLWHLRRPARAALALDTVVVMPFAPVRAEKNLTSVSTNLSRSRSHRRLYARAQVVLLRWKVALRPESFMADVVPPAPSC